MIVAEVTRFLSAPAREVLDHHDSSPEERLRRLLRVHVDAACANRTSYQIVLHEEAELSARARRRFRAWERQVTNDLKLLLDECLANESLPAALDTAVAANLVLSMTTNLYTWYDPCGPVSPDELFEQLLLITPLARTD